ncbi:hypothetical protein M0802_015240 [Mischocyttarus mexicanus]|nr:hypothetical protein M0802_015245 [Mischocyttarus mexicanus]KAI4475228.1 hypothetical protein M0802_015240 [Mischocyttarus mexicanus]
MVLVVKKNNNVQEQIVELNSNKRLEEDRNYNNDDCKDNLESQISNIKMIEDVQYILSNDVDCLKNSNGINKIEQNNEQVVDSTMPLIQSNVVEQKDKLNKNQQKKEHTNNVSDIAAHIMDNKLLNNSKKLDKLILEKSYEGIIQTDDSDLLNDNDDKWSIVGNLDDFVLGKAILSILSVNPTINNGK